MGAFLHMSITFLNAAMLAGLLTIVLPILAHLLSKRRYDVVQWGAMQFLQLGHKTRRRIRLQDLLLLILRMLALVCLVLALAQPFGRGAMFAPLSETVHRDVVFIIDGSGSMGWQGDNRSPHAAAIQWVYDALEDLNPGDTVSILDARSRNRRLIHPPTSNLAFVRGTLESVPEPTGTSDLNEAVVDAIRILSTTSHAAREIVVLTDAQAYPWKLDDQFALQRLDDLLKQPEVTPTIAVVNLAENRGARANWSVGQIRLSREMTVPGFPIRFEATIRQSAGVPTQKAVTLSVNGQQVPDRQHVVNLLPDGEAVVAFEHLFPEPGNYRLTLTIEADQLPEDDHSDAIVVVEDGIPVLLVDGDPHLDRTRNETFFLESAFAASGADSPWVRATIIEPHELNAQRLSSSEIVFLCNVGSLSPAQRSDLLDFVLAGGGVVVAPGEKTESATWNAWQLDEQGPVLPARFASIQQETQVASEIVTVDSLSLQQSWLLPFNREKGVDFVDARFTKWWQLPLHAASDPSVAGHADANPADAEVAEIEGTDSGEIGATPASITARLTSGDPFIVQKQLGQGTILQFAAPLDADWSTLPARNDFVPFVHELVFQLVQSEVQHNVPVGSAIQIPLADDERPRDYVVSGPGVHRITPTAARAGRTSLAAFHETTIPGEYWFQKKNDPDSQRIPFIVSDDRAESDLLPLDELAWQTLQANGRMQQIDEMSGLTEQLHTANSQSELWWLFLLLLLGMLTCEVALTRRMVKEGHTALEIEDTSQMVIT